MSGMDRRTFIKTTVVGSAVVSAFGFQLAPVYAQTQALKIARKVKDSRDATFVEQDDKGNTVNRCEELGWIGGCTDTNELNFLAVKTMRSMGVCYFETQARV